MSLDEMEDSTDVLPEKRARRAYTYVVAVKTPIAAPDDEALCTLHEFSDTNGGRTAALKYVNSIGVENVARVYKVAQVLDLKVKTEVKISF